MATALGDGLDDGLTRPGEAVGTLAYMSPEQIRRNELDARTDLFALGGVLYEMATGQQAFPGPAPAVVCDAILHGSPTPPMRLNPELPARLEEIILRALDKDLDRRYQHASDLSADLKRLQRDFDSGRSPAPETMTKGTAVATPPTLAHKPRHRWGPSLGVAILLAILGVLGRRFLPGADTLPAKIRPLTTDGGFKYFPSLSPDGEMVAYVRLDLTGDSCGNIYVKALFPGARPLCLTEGSGFDGFPAWSPDGKQIAFLRGFKNGGAALVTIPSLGGRERKVSELHWRLSQSPGRPLPGAPSWSPDGQYLAVADPDPDYSAIRIYRVSLDTMETRTLTSPPEGFLGDVFPAFSPDGRHLAFCRSSSGHFVGTWDVWVQPAEGGDARRLTSGSYDFCWGLTWTSEGDGLVFSTMGQVLRVPLAGGEPEPLVGVGQNAISPSVQGDRMAYVQMIRSPRELWRLAGRKTPRSRRAPVKLVTSRGVDATPAYSPDGRRIAFSSSRSGVRNIWLCDSDCSDPVQLTDFEAHTGSPRWGPDGHRIAFESVEKGDWNLYIVDTEGGAPLQLTSQPSDENVPFWSRDGRWIYFHSNRSGRQQIWKMPAEGGAAVQLTQDGGCWAQESRDGRFVYYSKDQVEPSPLWRVPVDGGEETEILGERITPGHWALGRSGIYFFRIPLAYGEQGSRWSIQYIDLESREVTELFRKDGPFDHWPLAVSPDEEWILYGERPVGTSELMLVENFR